MSFSVVVSVGPGEKERQRLSDLLATLERFEADSIHEVLLVDDGAKLKANGLSKSIAIRIVPTPRGGMGDNWRGGLVTNVLAGFAAALAQDDIEFVLKLDTDSLLIRPVSENIRAGFAMEPGIGMLGSCFARNLHGDKLPPSTWRVNLAKWMKLMRLRRNPVPHLETAFWGRNRVIRRLILRAVSNGWPLGQCAQGGGYAVRREILGEWLAAGWFEDSLLWRHTDLGEDIVSALLCYAIGRTIHDYNAPGEPFGVQFMGLGFPVPALFARGYGIVHSVKLPDPADERHLREQFFEKIGGATALKVL